MHFKQFPGTDMNVSTISVGTWGTGGYAWGEDFDEAAAIDAIVAMLDAGVNFIDTAPAYGCGYAEQLVGKAIAGRKDKVFIATKFGSTQPGGVGTPYIRDNSRANCLKECDESLSRLGVDCIDLYIIHWPDPNVPIAETMGALTDLQKAGKIRYIGVSNFSPAQIEEARAYGEIVMNQLPYSMINRYAEDTMAWCMQHGAGIMTYGSLGAGLLSGKIRQKPQFSPEDIRGGFYGNIYAEPNFSNTMKLMETLDAIAADHSVPVSQVAINWSRQHPLVTSAILGVRSRRHALENAAALSWDLSDAEMARINLAIEATVGMGASVGPAKKGD
nr:aldo/keto reductase [Maliibacterium massiliense]